MSYLLTWLPDVLLKAGLKVAEVPGWRDRGNGDVGQILGVMCHHTAGQRDGNMPTLRTLIEGRPDLQGPLAQLGLGRDGTYYVVAAGKCNHAGAGSWKGITTGNTSFVAIEAENTGLANDTPWPTVQMDAYRRGVAAVLMQIKRSADFCTGHKEYALPAGRKTDPDFDMDTFRKGVSAILDGTAPAPVLIPKSEPDSAGAPPRATLQRGAHGDLVEELQRDLKMPEIDGLFGGVTEAAVRQFQRQNDLVPDGIVGPKTWAKLAPRPAPS
jgi:peptidoglycan hydrolase-like protein with peptidoglycan-binding domain